MSRLKLFFFAAVVLSTFVGGLAIWAALEHNPQEAFVHPETGVDVGGLLLIFLSWFIVTFGILGASGLALFGLGRLFGYVLRRS